MEEDFPMPFVDTNDNVFLYETLPCTRIRPGMARRAAKTVCPDAGEPDGREERVPGE